MDQWRETLDGLSRGELEAFDRVTCLITNHLARIGAYRYRDSWDDLVQEVLVSLLRNPPTAEESAAIVRHIQTTSYRKFVDQVRRERGRRGDASTDAEGSSAWRQNVPLEEATDVIDAGLGSETFGRDLRRALEGLSDDERMAVECRYLLGCSNSEGASRLEVSLATYKRRLSEGMAALRERFVVPAGDP